MVYQSIPGRPFNSMEVTVCLIFVYISQVAVHADSPSPFSHRQPLMSGRDPLLDLTEELPTPSCAPERMDTSAGSGTKTHKDTDNFLYHVV
jgi:hypothetical protein